MNILNRAALSSRRDAIIKIQVKTVQEAVKDWRDQYTYCYQQDHAGEQSIERGKDFSCSSLQWIDRAHPAQQHGRIDQRIDP